MPAEQNIERVKRFIESGLGQEQLEPLMADTCAPGLVLEAPGVPLAEGRVRGYQALLEHLLQRARALPDMRVELLQLVGEAESVSFDLAFEGTHTRPWLGVPPSHARVRFTELWYVECDTQGRFMSVRLCEHGTPLPAVLREAASSRA